MKNIRQKNSDDLVPFITIREAVEGRPEAIGRILDHFDPYIRSLSRGLYIKPNGEYQYVIDKQMHDEIAVKLIDAILKFRIRY